MSHAPMHPVPPRPRPSVLDPLRRAMLRSVAIAVLLSGLTVLTADASPASAATSRSVLRAGVVELTNVARLAAGCRPVKVSKKLRKAAQRHAKDMARHDYFGHTSRNGREWDDRIRKAGYRRPGGENIAHGFPSAASVVRAWLRSPSHRRNIRNCEFRRIGIGFRADGDYWVQDFGY